MLTIALCLLAGTLLWPASRALVPAGRDRGGVPAEASPPPLLTQVADATDLLALALGSGSAIPDALESVAQVSGPEVALDLRRVAAALRWGRSMREAWDYASPGWHPTATALVVAAECGAPTVAVLEEAAARTREAESRRLESAAGRAGVLLVIPLGLFFLPAFIATSVIPLLVVLLGEQLR